MQIARDARVCLFTKLRASDVPGLAIVEIAAGDGALALRDDEVDALFRRLLSGARA